MEIETIHAYCDFQRAASWRFASCQDVCDVPQPADSIAICISLTRCVFCIVCDEFVAGIIHTRRWMHAAAHQIFMCSVVQPHANVEQTANPFQSIRWGWIKRSPSRNVMSNLLAFNLTNFNRTRCGRSRNTIIHAWTCALQEDLATRRLILTRMETSVDRYRNKIRHLKVITWHRKRSQNENDKSHSHCQGLFVQPAA